MTDRQAADVAELMNRMPEVRWDRYVEGGGELAAYGWIDRPDGRADFLTLTFHLNLATEEGIPVGFTTSSAALSRTFMERLYGTAEGHLDCQRVEGAPFGPAVANKVTLDPPASC